MFPLFMIFTALWGSFLREEYWAMDEISVT